VPVEERVDGAAEIAKLARGLLAPCPRGVRLRGERLECRFQLEAQGPNLAARARAKDSADAAEEPLRDEEHRDGAAGRLAGVAKLAEAARRHAYTLPA
jgi:hypothetical protein